jgi:PAS domain S-box-containing protein
MERLTLAVNNPWPNTKTIVMGNPDRNRIEQELPHRVEESDGTAEPMPSIVDADMHILLVQANPAEVACTREALERRFPFRLTHVERLEEARRSVVGGHFDLVLLDLDLPDSQGLDSLLILRREAPDVPVVVMSASADEELALRAVQEGALDCLVKDQVQVGTLARSIRLAIARKRAHEQRFRGAFEHTSVAMVLTDLNHRFVRVNAAFARLFGYSQEEMRTLSMADVTHPEHLAESYAQRIPLLTGESSFFQMEKRYLHRDGHVFWGLTNVSLVHDASGRPLLYVGQVLDISNRKRAEVANAKYTERLRVLHQIDRALIAGEEPAAIAAGALVPLRELLGVPRAVVNLFDLANGEVEWLAAAGRRRVRVGPGVRYSIQFMGDVGALRRGERQLIDVHALPPGPEVDALLASGVHAYVVVPMIARGELIGALSFGDASAPLTAEQLSIAQEAATQFAIAIMHARLNERVKRQAQDLEIRVRERTQELEIAQATLQNTNTELMKSAAELQAANKELEAFSYSVSHDLRAPLRAIDGFSRIVLEDHGAKLPEDGRSCLEVIRANTVQMGRLVDDLLAFSRLGRQAVKRQVVDSTQLVHDCLGALQRSPPLRHMDIRVAELPCCQADPALLKQVWLNLLANAFKYTGNRESAVIEVGCRRDGGRNVFFVKDNGVGFDMRYAHKLFGVFQRLHRAEDYEGTGVGLAIVQRIVERHGGQVWADAKVDEGATFSFTLDPEGQGILDAQE